MKELDFSQIRIYSEYGTEIVITSLNDLPHLTTGLLEVNICKAQGSSERHSSAIILLYLYLLRDFQWSGIFPDEILITLGELFPQVLEVAALCHVKHMETWKDQEVIAKRCGERLHAVNPPWKKYIQQHFHRFREKVSDELVEFGNTPLPVYFTNNRNDPNVWSLTHNERSSGFELEGTFYRFPARESLQLARHYYRGALLTLRYFFS